MTRSLFARLAATHLTVAFLSLVALGLLLAGLLQSFVYREKERTLLAYGRELSRLLESLPRFPGERRLTLVQLRILDELAGARIWIVAPDGTVVAASRPLPHRVVQLPAADMERILAGGTVTRRGYFQGRFPEPVISVGLPLTVGEETVGAIFLHAPVPEVRAALRPIHRLLGLSALAAAAVALGLSLWLSRRLAHPLREMGAAAQELAQGRFHRRVAVPPGDDEVARLAAAFNDMAARLEATERQRREFLANVSHELRSPLTSMRGFLQAVLDGTAPPGDRERYLRLAFDETRRLSRLVNDLLDLAALEAGDVRFALADLDPAEALRRAVAKMEPQAAEKDLRLTLELPGEPLPAVRADPDRLEQVLINLLDNAVRFTPPGGTVTAGARAAPSGVELWVRDTGPGIATEDLERIWERFYKADRARTRTRGGTGLGLAIARQLVERQGGTIRAESRPGEGATFVVTLPRAGGPHPAPSPPGAAGPPAREPGR